MKQLDDYLKQIEMWAAKCDMPLLPGEPDEVEGLPQVSWWSADEEGAMAPLLKAFEKAKATIVFLQKNTVTEEHFDYLERSLELYQFDEEDDSDLDDEDDSEEFEGRSEEVTQNLKTVRAIRDYAGHIGNIEIVAVLSNPPMVLTSSFSTDWWSEYQSCKEFVDANDADEEFADEEGDEV
jgi:hypothetical protein